MVEENYNLEERWGVKESGWGLNRVCSVVVRWRLIGVLNTAQGGADRHGCVLKWVGRSLAQRDIRLSWMVTR